MDHSSHILVTGAAGFIGSCMVGYLNKMGYSNIIIVDEFTEEDKDSNYVNKKFIAKIERKDLFEWLKSDLVPLNFVFHLGARTDTTEFDYAVHEKLNVEYSKQVWNHCAQKEIPLLYASSAATYGSGEFGYNDDHDVVDRLKPLNPYGVSKNEFDKWVLHQAPDNQPPYWAGLKFFNVYGPNEYHKARMASVVFHAYKQIEKNGKVKLFRSHNPEYRDGEQLRDFIYIEDVLKIMNWMMEAMYGGQWTKSRNGIYNVGTGRARTFNDLVTAIFNTMQIPHHIEYIDTPEDIRNKYQYFTEARMHKLREAGYNSDFFSLEKGVGTYVRDFLMPHKYY